MPDPKDYGSGISQVLDATDRAWDGLIFQSGKPVLDWEQNLQSDIEIQKDLALKRAVAHSGFLTSFGQGFRPESVASDFVFYTGVGEEDQLTLRSAYVYISEVGVITLAGSVVGVGSLISLPAAPASGVEHNFVFLEVWRQLVEASPSTTGKSPLGRIFAYGNTDITDPAIDAAVNYTDDLQDPVLGAPTSKRVQVQYRIRVVDDVDQSTYPRPLDDSAIEAQGGQGAPVGGYSFTRSIFDSGLWVAGTGSTADQTALGTVDGYVWAIPICVVSRRNQTTYSMWTNKDGGRSHTSGVPADDRDERPDGLFYDLIAEQDVIDHRMFTSLHGFNAKEVLQRTMDAIFDNTLETQWEADIHGPGPAVLQSKRLLFLNEIGNSSGPGTPATSGDTVAGQFIRNMDNVCRRFSDRAIVENPIHVEPSPGSWSTLDTVTVDLANPTPGTEGFNPYPMSTGVGIDLDAIAPNGTHILDVVVYREGHDASSGTALVDVDSVTGLGTSRVVITLGSNVAGYTDDLWVEVWIQYPSGVGLQRGPYETYALDGIKVYDTTNRHPDAAENDPATDKCGIVSGDQSLANEEDLDYKVAPREVELYYRSDPASLLTLSVPAATTTTVWLPERADRIDTVNAAGTFTHVRGSRMITWTGAPLTPGAPTSVDYVALRPLPYRNNAGTALNWQIGVNYRSPAPQSTPFISPAGPLEILCVSDFLYVLTQGSGSFTDSGYPFQAPFDQIPLPAIGATIAGDHLVTNPLELTSIDDFNANTGILKILANIPFLSWPPVELDGQLTDGENRSFYSTVTSYTGFLASAAGQELSTFATHRVVLPFLTKKAEDSGGADSELYVGLVFAYIENAGKNQVRLVTAADDVNGVALYRVPFNMLANKSRLA